MSVLGRSDKLLVVTAFDESHRLEAHGLLHSVHRHLPKARVLIFALEMLAAIDLATLKAACGVEVRTFDWARWAPSLHRKLYGCGWKPTVIRVALDKARATSRSHVLWVDASVRFTADAARELSQAAALGSIAARYTIGTVLQYTHPGTLGRWEALRGGRNGTNPTTAALRKGALAAAARRERMLAATIVLWPSRGGVAVARALQRWEQCCLDPDCFAPPNARGQPCPGCHRYDQSALNLALLDTGLAAQCAAGERAHRAGHAHRARGARPRDATAAQVPGRLRTTAPGEEASKTDARQPPPATPHVKLEIKPASHGAVPFPSTGSQVIHTGFCSCTIQLNFVALNII